MAKLTSIDVMITSCLSRLMVTLCVFSLAVSRALRSVAVSVAVVLGFSCPAYAQLCGDIFTNGLSINSGSGFAELRFRSNITGGSAVIDTPTLRDFSSSSACSGNVCSASGSPSDTSSPAFVSGAGAAGNVIVPTNATASIAAGDYNNVVAGARSTLNFTSSNDNYLTKHINADERSTLVLATGNYWIDGSFNLGSRGVLSSDGSGTVRIFVRGDVNLNERSVSSGFMPGQLLIYATGRITLHRQTNFTGFFYSASGTVDLFEQAVVNGGVSAASAIMQDHSIINFDPLALAGSDFAPFCNAGAPAVDHLSFNVAGSASTCVATPVTIRVCTDALCSSTVPSYTGSVTLSTSRNHGNWSLNSGGGSIAPSPDNDDNGSVVYTFAAAANGEATLNLANAHAETLTISGVESVDAAVGSSGNVSFSDNAFVLSILDGLGADIVAGRDHQFQIEMVRRGTAGDPSSDCGVASNYNTNDIKAWIVRDGDDPGGVAPALITSSETQLLGDAEPAADNLSLSFVNGSAFFSLSTADVGKYQLAFQDDSASFAQTEINGSSSTLVVRPFGFAIDVSGNPAAADASAAVFTRAGENFQLSVRPVLWEAADDLNNDGQPDNHADTIPNNNADLSNNGTAIRFGFGSAVQDVLLASYLVAPAGGADAGLQDGDAGADDARELSVFSGGVSNSASTSQVFFPEVGIIEVTAALNSTSYLGRTASVTGSSGYVGRFVADKFVLLEDTSVGALDFDSVIDETCGSFSYLQQDFSVSVYYSAVNSSGNLTTNYRGAFAKLDGVADVLEIAAVDTVSNTNLSSRLSVVSLTSADWALDIDGDSVIDYGYGLLSLDLQLARTAAPDGPYNSVFIGIVPRDDDTVTIPAADFDLDVDGLPGNDSMRVDSLATAFRFGRLWISNAHGPETAALPVALQTQFWSISEGFTLNTADSCTSLAMADIRFDNRALSTDANRTVTLGSGSTTGSFGVFNPGINMRFVDGSASLIFSPPGIGNGGEFMVDVELGGTAWLRNDWNNNGDFSDDVSLPSAEIQFGRYRGHDRIIFWRERL